MTWTSTSPAPACRPQRRARSSPTRSSRPTTDNAPPRARGTTVLNRDVAPFDNVECRKAVVLRATTRPATSAPTAATPVATIAHEPPAAARPRPRRVRPVRRQGQAAGRPRRRQGRAHGVRSAGRLRDQHLLPCRASEGEGHGRVASGVAREGRHQGSTSRPSRRLTTSSSTPASPTTPRRTTSASSSRAGALTGPTASASCRRSSTAGSSAPPATPTSASRSPAVDAEIDQAHGRDRRRRRDAIWGNDRQVGHGGAAVLPGVWAKGLLYRSDNVTNVFVNDGFTHVRLRRDGCKQSSNAVLTAPRRPHRK